MKARLIHTDHVADETAAFTFELQDRLSFEAGQTCDVTLTSPRFQDEKGSVRTFSIASSPSELPRLLFATRLTGSAFKRTLLESAPGLEIGLDGPFGSFVLHKNAAKPAVLFAGGIGITPFRSIVKDATERRLPHRITLLYANRTEASTAFLTDFQNWQRSNANFRLVASVAEPATSEPWIQHKGLMNSAFIKPYIANADNAICYLAGPPGFVKAMRAALDELGADPDNIRTEEFAGY